MASRLAGMLSAAESPLAHRYMRVCWRHTHQDLNCGACEKCLRTQLEFLAAGTLDRFRTFPPGSLAEKIDALPGVMPSIERYYHQVLEHVDDRAVRTAIRALVDRSPAWRRRQRWRGRLVGAARFLRWRYR